MVLCHQLLESTNSKMVLSCHDELVFNIRYGDEHLIPEIKKIMESTWNGSPLTLEVDVEYGKENYHDKQKVLDLPCEQETRNAVQGTLC